MAAKKPAKPVAPLVRTIEDLLASWPMFSWKRMFGGYGLYDDGVFFGIVDGDAAFFRVNDEQRERYKVAGMGPFNPTPDWVAENYYQVPGDVLESPVEFAAWAKRAVICGKEAATKKSSKKGKRAPKV